MTLRHLKDQFAQAARVTDTIVRDVCADRTVYTWLSALPQAVWTVEAQTRHRPIFDRSQAIGGALALTDVDVAAQYEWGVVAAELGVAETGSVMLVEPELTTRAVSMSSQQLVVLLPQSRLRSALDDVADWLEVKAGPIYVTLLSGPSRTADIERSLTVGVQGPQEVHVVLT